MISILVPSYNHARFLHECLSSGLGQTYADLEVVFVDDGSSDESVDAARSINDSRLRIFVNDENLGTYGTLNRALELARGEFVAILNSDDLWEREKLSRQMALWDRYGGQDCPPTLSFTLGQMIDEHGAALDQPIHADWPKEEIHDYLPWLITENRILASSVLFPRNRAHFDSTLRFSGDWAVLLSLARTGPGLCVCEPLVSWRQHASNSYVRSLAVTLEEIRMRRSILAAFNSSTSLHKALAVSAMHCSALYVLLGDRAKAVEMIREARRLDPDNPIIRKRSLLTRLPLPIAQRRLWGRQDLGRNRGADDETLIEF